MTSQFRPRTRPSSQYTIRGYGGEVVLFYERRKGGENAHKHALTYDCFVSSERMGARDTNEKCKRENTRKENTRPPPIQIRRQPIFPTTSSKSYSWFYKQIRGYS